MPRLCEFPGSVETLPDPPGLSAARSPVRSTGRFPYPYNLYHKPFRLLYISILFFQEYALRWAKGTRGISISPFAPLESPYPLKRSGLRPRTPGFSANLCIQPRGPGARGPWSSGEGDGRSRRVWGTEACRRQWRIQAGGVWEIARSGNMPRLCEFPGSVETLPDPPGLSAARSPVRSTGRFPYPQKRSPKAASLSGFFFIFVYSFPSSSISTSA